MCAVHKGFSKRKESTTAEPLYHRVLQILQKALGEAHPDVATSLNNLAVRAWP